MFGGTREILSQLSMMERFRELKPRDSDSYEIGSHLSYRESITLEEGIHDILCDLIFSRSVPGEISVENRISAQNLSFFNANDRFP